MTQGLSVSPLELHKRTNTDCAWAIGYLTTAAVAIVAGIYGASANNLYGTNGLLNPPTTCTNRRQLTTNLAPYISIAYEVGPPTLAFSGFFALLIGSIWMAALQCAAKPVVIGTLVLKGIVLIGLALGALVIGLPMITSSIFLIIALLYFAFLYCARRKIALTSALLEQSVRVSSAHPGIYPVAFLLLVLATIVYVAALVSAGFLYTNGEFTVDTFRDSSYDTYTSCVWQPSMIAYVSGGVTAFFGLWSFELFYSIRFFVVSFVTGTWYYKNAAAGNGNVVGMGATAELASTSLTGQVRAPVTTGLSLAFSKSFGSLCFASLVITICEMLKRLARRAASADNNLVLVLIACCISCILNYIEFLTKFAVSFHALTGDPFCTSARTFTAHLKRHGITAYFVDVLSSVVLSFGGFVLALFVAASTVGVIYNTSIKRDDQHSSWDETTTMVLVTIGVVALGVAWLILSFIGGLLLNVVDASYTCMVLDLDHGAAAQPEMAKVIIQCVQPTYVIQQPGNAPPVLAGQPRVGQGGTYPPTAIPIVNARPVSNLEVERTV